MGVSPARWLVDKSALARVHLPEVANVILPRTRAGLLGICVVTELEVGFSARSEVDYRAVRREMLDHLLPVPVPVRAEQRAREVQAALVGEGQHRSAGVSGLLLAAVAEVEQLVLLHYDADFDCVAAVTQQATEWVVPRGTIT